MFTNIAEAARFWTFWYKDLAKERSPNGYGAGSYEPDTMWYSPPRKRSTTPVGIPVDEPVDSSTPYYLPSTVEINGKNPRDSL